MEHIEGLNGAEFTDPKSITNNETHQQKWAIVSLASIPLVMTLGNSMLLPVLPTMEKELNISPFQSSLIITVYSIVAIILIPIAGFLSDKWGRKKIIIPSLFIAAIGGLISGIAGWLVESAYLFILFGRLLQGVGAAGAFPIVLPLVGDMFRKEEDVSSALGVIETANTFGKVLSPVLGAALAAIIWYIPFFAFPFFCAITILMVMLLVKTPKKDQEVVSFGYFIKNIKKIFHIDGKWLFSIFFIGGILMLVLFGELFYLSKIFEDQYNIKDIQKGFYLAIPLGALCLASFIAGKVIKKNKVLMKWLTFFGVLALGITGFLVIFSTQLWYLIVLFTIGGIGIGVALPSLDALITEGVEKEQRGTITSLYSSMRFVGVAAGPPIVALLMKTQKAWIFGAFLVLCLLSCLLTFKAIKPESDQ
ncbi:ACDE family multidrug resistance protein [Bacillus oleivorans]|uniref:ACDE family multidrug resistance protein n=1 Tax=Bacillus oleivorans TaxID=1448271 RepID=A0A285CLX6_9BACI|nr:MFS transporter [Bacillus oleivorans]SNX68405.1 ACDE family multidrug resistance protein [Bacillus oleivorans]